MARWTWTACAKYLCLTVAALYLYPEARSVAAYVRRVAGSLPDISGCRNVAYPGTAARHDAHGCVVADPPKCPAPRLQTAVRRIGPDMSRCMPALRRQVTLLACPPRMWTCCRPAPSARIAACPKQIWPGCGKNTPITNSRRATRNLPWLPWWKTHTSIMFRC